MLKNKSYREILLHHFDVGDIYANVTPGFESRLHIIAETLDMLSQQFDDLLNYTSVKSISSKDRDL